jgi:hypothetical protein
MRGKARLRVPVVATSFQEAMRRIPPSWRDATAPALVSAYIMCLPLQALGVAVANYSFSPADAVLVAAVLVFVRRLAEGRPSQGFPLLGPGFVRLGVILGGFLVVAICSLAASATPPDRGLVRLLPYLHAGVVILVFGGLLTNIGHELRRTWSLSLAASIAVISVGALIPTGWIPEWDRIALDPGGHQMYLKYRFLLPSPTQLSVLVVVFFAMLTLLRIGCELDPWVEIVIPALFTNVILLTGSRIAPLSALVLLAIFWGSSVREAFAAGAVVRGRRAVRLATSVGLALLLGLYQLDGPRSLTAYRSVNGVQSLLLRILPAASDRFGHNFLWHEHLADAYSLRDRLDGLAVQTFSENRVWGVGLGWFASRVAPRGARIEVHNTALSVAAEVGLPGLGVLLVLLGRLIVVALRPAGSRRIEAVGRLSVLMAVLLPHWVHYLLRERWFWLFTVFVTWLSVRFERPQGE